MANLKLSMDKMHKNQEFLIKFFAYESELKSVTVQTICKNVWAFIEMLQVSKKKVKQLEKQQKRKEAREARQLHRQKKKKSKNRNNDKKHNGEIFNAKT